MYKVALALYSQSTCKFIYQLGLISLDSTPSRSRCSSQSSATQAHFRIRSRHELIFSRGDSIQWALQTNPSLTYATWWLPVDSTQTTTSRSRVQTSRYWQPRHRAISSQVKQLWKISGGSSVLIIAEHFLSFAHGQDISVHRWRRTASSSAQWRVDLRSKIR